MAENQYDKNDRIRRGQVVSGAGLKIASYKVRDPETDQWSDWQFHVTYNNHVVALMGHSAAKLFSQFVARHDEDGHVTEEERSP